MEPKNPKFWSSARDSNPRLTSYEDAVVAAGPAEHSSLIMP